MYPFKHQLRLAFAASLVLLLQTPITQAADATWVGNMFFTNAANWNPAAVPAAGNNMIITESSSSTNCLITEPVTVGQIVFGDTGARNTAFYLSNGVPTSAGTIPLTMTGGMIANGFNGALGTKEMFRLPVVIQGDQTFTIGGGTANNTTDAGIRFRERSNGNQNAITLNGTLTKSGPGMLSFVGNYIGNGNIVVNQGVVKFNGGGSTKITVTGTGAITVNNGGAIFFSRNSGALEISKAIVLNDGSAIRIGGGTANETFGSPVTFNGTVNAGTEFTASSTQPVLTLTNTWSGNGTLNMVNHSTSVSNYWVFRESLAGIVGRVNTSGAWRRIRFGTNATGSASAEWALNSASAAYEAFGATNIVFGALSGNSGTVRSVDPNGLPVKFTVGALNSDTTFNGVIVDGDAIFSVVSLEKVGTGRLTVGGNSTFTGGTVIHAGAIYSSGANAALGSGPVSVLSGATLGDLGPLTVSSLTFGSTGSDFTTNAVNPTLGGKIIASSLTVNGKCTINILGPALPVGAYDLINYSGAIGGAGFSGFLLGRLPYGIVANLVDTGSAIQLNVSENNLETRIWIGGIASQWNLGPNLEWKGLVTSAAQNFHDEDEVLFNNTAASFNVEVTELVQPKSVVVDNTTTYTFSGAGTVDGNSSLTKNNTGALILGNTNLFTGGITINSGVLQIGDGATAGALAGPMTNNAAVVLNRADAGAFTGGMTGPGTVEKKGLGTFLLGGNNSYLGTMTISEGTLRAGSGTALGDTNVATTIANGATLDINTQSLGMEPVFVQGAGVGGAGAIVNNGTEQQQALRFVTLTGPTTFGGASRWDLRNPVNAEPGHAWLQANGHKLTKVSSNVISFISIGDTGMGDMDIQDGTITISRSTSFGNPAGTVTLWPNAHLQFHRLEEFIVNPFDKKIAMTNAFIAVESNGLTNTLAGTIQMTGSNIFTIPTTTTGLKMDNAVSGNSSLVIVGPGALILNGNATHTGGTIVNNAIMTVNGTLGPSGQPLTLLGGNTLAGNGTIRDAVTLPLGSILSPGEGDIGSLGINAALVLQAGGVTHIEYNKDMGTNDNVRGLSSVTYGGTLVLTNTGFTTVVPGDSFKLFYAGSYSGAFDTIVPAVPASGLKWNTSSLTVNGTLSVMLDPSIQPPVVYSASSLVSNSLNVIFNLEVEDATALDPSNYTLSTGQNVISAIKVTPNNIQLTLDAPITAPTYSVQVKNVRNTAFAPLTMVTTNVPGVAHGFANSMGVGIFDGFAYAYGTNKIHVFASGSDIFNTQDQFQFTWREVTGDFDLSVDLHYLLDTDPAAKAGLMARDIADASFPLIQERNITIAGFPGQGQGRNQNLFQYREEQGGNSVAPASPRPTATYPDNWLRLRRKGSVFYSMVSSNNLDWISVNAVDTSTNSAGALPATLRVGLAVTAHNTTAGVLTEAIYSNLGTPQDRPKLTMVNSTNAVNVLELSWPSWLTGTYKLQSTASLTPPIVWTDVPGTLTTNFTTHVIGAGSAFFRLAP